MPFDAAHAGPIADHDVGAHAARGVGARWDHACTARATPASARTTRACRAEAACASRATACRQAARSASAAARCDAQRHRHARRAGQRRVARRTRAVSSEACCTARPSADAEPVAASLPGQALSSAARFARGHAAPEHALGARGTIPSDDAGVVLEAHACGAVARVEAARTVAAVSIASARGAAQPEKTQLVWSAIVVGDAAALRLQTLVRGRGPRFARHTGQHHQQCACRASRCAACSVSTGFGLAHLTPRVAPRQPRRRNVQLRKDRNKRLNTPPGPA
jgi:hypothetical protein